jgi:hypothetical protein
MIAHNVKKVYNADQTGVNFEMLPKKTLTARGVQTVWVKCGEKEKQRATVMLLADSDGNKYAPWIIFKTQRSKIPEIQALNEHIRHGFGKQLW